MKLDRVIGIDFSGAAKAGENIWVAQAIIVGGRLKLISLDALKALAGTIERGPALQWLVDFIRGQHSTLIGIDFPFGLPTELGWSTWDAQLAAVANWTAGANEFGRECVRRARLLGDKMHIRRATDSETKTPFDCYHYRIIYQTFHGMRDVLLPLRRCEHVSVLPFDPRPKSVTVVEACPGSSLKAWGLPHNNYKQPAGGALEAIRRKNRRTILDAVKSRIEIDPAHERIAMRNPGGDALDAIIACCGPFHDVLTCDHKAIARHERYPREGRVYC